MFPLFLIYLKQQHNMQDILILRLLCTAFALIALGLFVALVIANSERRFYRKIAEEIHESAIDVIDEAAKKTTAIRKLEQTINRLEDWTKTD